MDIHVAVSLPVNVKGDKGGERCYYIVSNLFFDRCQVTKTD